MAMILSTEMMGNDKEKALAVPAQPLYFAWHSGVKQISCSQSAEISSMERQMKGFTLLELMIAVSLGVILLGIGAPALSSLVNENTLKFESRTLLKHLRFARSQAIDNQFSVTACLADANDSCVLANPTQMLIFIDDDASNAFNGGELLLARSHPFPGNMTVVNNRRTTLFSPDGSSLGTNATLNLCAQGMAQINLVIAPSGRSTQATQNNICP
ncbi:GspH/FimT family pseudopilin [Aeromonas rivuli]|uniref:GspH/FimT family pseudopilin n=1 Tax=Aeromonas rivuli TaxID=648794 RepID=UPI001CCD2487|nr:GspH/FimT family pseudopilin [Aeromonas rivuli]